MSRTFDPKERDGVWENFRIADDEARKAAENLAFYRDRLREAEKSFQAATTRRDGSKDALERYLNEMQVNEVHES